LIVNQAMFVYVNQARIHSWNQPVLSNEGIFFLLKETTGAFDVTVANPFFCKYCKI